VRSITLAVLMSLCAFSHAQQERSAIYQIDSEQSRVHWLVYSAGALSRLGHNHVISVPLPSGVVRLDPQLSSFVLEIPVEALVVDDPALRARLGNGFSGTPSADDIEGTRRNMLSARLLNVEQYPTLRIAGAGPVGEAGSQTMNLTVHIAGNTAELVVPVTVRIDDEVVQAEGSFQLTHEQLGLRPFSALLGAIKVAEQMDFSYFIVARQCNSAAVHDYCMPKAVLGLHAL